MHLPLLCQHCGLPALDAVHTSETDQDGNTWVYCRPCDSWTSHPSEPPKPDPTPKATRITWRTVRTYLHCPHRLIFTKPDKPKPRTLPFQVTLGSMLHRYYERHLADIGPNGPINPRLAAHTAKLTAVGTKHKTLDLQIALTKSLSAGHQAYTHTVQAILQKGYLVPEPTIRKPIAPGTTAIARPDVLTIRPKSATILEMKLRHTGPQSHRQAAFYACLQTTTTNHPTTAFTHSFLDGTTTLVNPDPTLPGLLAEIAAGHRHPTPSPGKCGTCPYRQQCAHAAKT